MMKGVLKMKKYMTIEELYQYAKERGIEKMPIRISISVDGAIHYYFSDGVHEKNLTANNGLNIVYKEKEEWSD